MRIFVMWHDQDTAQPSFLVYDYETFGTHHALDRPAQFAAIRTNTAFQVISEPEVFLCRPTEDYLPDPEAVLITGITPQQALREGINEADFARRIYQLFTVPKTCILGYNNIYFDDEVSRHLFYRNFYNPYDWSWKKGNSRWDLLGVARACYALRPDGIKWPSNDDGLPSFRLEHLSKANHIEHAHAHDAMADVYATLEIAKLMHKAQPKLFGYLYHHRQKKQLKSLIDVDKMNPLVHISSIFGAARGNTAWIAPLCWEPNNHNALIVCDLSGDIRALEDLNSDHFHTNLYSAHNSHGDTGGVPLKSIHINKCPVLAPANTLRLRDAVRLGINFQHCKKNLLWLREHPTLREKAASVFTTGTQFRLSNDVDAQLYNGFFSDADRAAINIVLATTPEKLSTLNANFVDPRLKPLLFRYRARNYPHLLNNEEQFFWLKYRKNRFTQSYLEAYEAHLENLSQTHKGDAYKTRLLLELFDYVQSFQ